LPLIFITPLSDVKVFEKDEAKFECEVSREPKTFRWLKGTQEIAGDDKFELIKDGTRHSMVIKSAAFEDEAKYIFEAEDKHTSGKLIIEGKQFCQMGHHENDFLPLFLYFLIKMLELIRVFCFCFLGFFCLDRNPAQIPYPSQGCNSQREGECCVYCGAVP
jgi:hypothetical protein